MLSRLDQVALTSRAPNDVENPIPLVKSSCKVPTITTIVGRDPDEADPSVHRSLMEIKKNPKKGGSGLPTLTHLLSKVAVPLATEAR